MYRIKDQNSEVIKIYKTGYYKRNTGANLSYLSSILNGNSNCTELLAKAILSIRFNISFTDEKMQELLEKYFEEEESYGGSNEAN